MTTPAKRKRYSHFSILNHERYFSYIAIAPAIIVLLVFMAYPIINVIYHSLTFWDGIKAKFIGIENYLSMLTNSDFWLVISNNVLYLAAIPLIVITALVIAVLLYEEIPGWRFFRSTFFLPYVLSAVVVGFLFRSFFSYVGPVNRILNALGLEAIAIDWLSSRFTAIAVIIAAVVWTQTGYSILVYLAGMSSISPSIFEAAKIDGANWFQKFFHVTLPMLIRTTEFLIILNSIFVFVSMFDYIYTITKGGPGYDTAPLTFWVYIKAFRASDMGYACALAIVLFLILITIAVIQRIVVNKVDEWSD